MTPPRRTRPALYDASLEEAVLGAMLHSAEVCRAGLDRLCPEDFGAPEARELFGLIGKVGEPDWQRVVHAGMQAGREIRPYVATLAGAGRDNPQLVDDLIELRKRRALEDVADLIDKARESPDQTGSALRLVGSMLSVGEFTLDEPSSNGVLAEPEWPSLDPAASEGLAGEVVDVLAPNTEASPVGLLLTFLTQYGALCGPSPHIRLSGAAHPARLFAVLVGDSGARKGGAESMVRWLMEMAAPTVVQDRWVKGLSSAEGLLDLVQDPVTNAKGEVVEAGASDKRLYVLEAEFTAVLDHFQRKGNTLSPMLRDAWDTGTLRKLTTTAPKTATGAHICIMGHSTPEELTSRLTRSEITNGFANRFLFAMVRSNGLLPFGGDIEEAELRPLARRVGETAGRARGLRRVEFAADARLRWPEVYERMRKGIPDGPIGHYLKRGDTQVLRLALVYALLEASPTIAWRHMASAMALWDYCAASVAYMLGHARTIAEGSSDDATELLALIQRRAGIGAADACRELGWNGTRLATARARAVRLRLLSIEHQRSENRGRPVSGMWPLT